MCKVVGHSVLWYKWMKINSFVFPMKRFLSSKAWVYCKQTSSCHHVGCPIFLTPHISVVGYARGHFFTDCFFCYTQKCHYMPTSVSVVSDGPWIMNSRSNDDGNRHDTFTLVRIMLIFLSFFFFFCSVAYSKTKYFLWLCMERKALLHNSQPCSSSILGFWIMHNAFLPRP